MTRKQREKIYREAAELIAKDKSEFCCHALSEIIFNTNDYWWKIKPIDFPELFVFEYKKEGRDAWWNSGNPIQDRNARILALLFAAEMTK